MSKLFIIQRIGIKEHTTDGVLFSPDGHKICNTAERTETMLPKGIYKLSLRKHSDYEEPLPYLLAEELRPHERVKDKAYLLPKTGVMSKGFGTSINVGEYLVPGVVIKPRQYVDKIIDKLKKYKETKDEIFVRIL